MIESRIALITGANKGIGFQTSRELARLGIKVLLGARDTARGETAAEKLRKMGLDVESILLDLTNSDHIRKTKEYVEKKFNRLDILVNNAGMIHPEEPLFENSVEHISAHAIRDTFEVNFIGLVELTQMLLPLIKKSKVGRIVNVSSVLGSLGFQSDPNSEFYQVKPFAYDASKTAVNQFTVHLAAALKDTSIKVNAAHPGWVRTDMGTENAPMDVVEGAKTSVALATLDADGPTGKFIHMSEELPW